MKNTEQHGRVVNGLMRSLLGLVLLLVASYVNDVKFGGAEAANRFSIGAGSLNWTANASWSTNTCGAALGATTAPTANDSVWICSGTSVVVNATAVAAQVLIANGGTLRGGTTRLTIGNTTNVGATLLTINGGTFTPQTGTVRFARGASATLITGTSTGITFNNVEIAPQLPGANITQTLAGGSIANLTVNGDMSVIPPDGTVGTARILTLNDGTLTSATVVGDLTLNAGNGAASNDQVNFNTGGIPWTLGSLVIGGTVGTGAQRFIAGASTVTFNAGSGTLLTRNANGNLSAGTSSFVMSPTGAVTLLSGGFVTAHVINNLTLSTAATTTATLATVAGTTATIGNLLSIASGVLDTGTAGSQIAGDGSATFSVSPGATFTMSGTSPFPAGFSTVGLAPTSTVEYRQTAGQTISARSYGNLLIEATSAGVQHTFTGASTTSAVNLTIGDGAASVFASAQTAGTILNVSGNVSISPASTLTANAASAFTVGGDWVNDGNFAANGGTVTFDGASAQTLTGASATVFNNLTISNTSTAGVASTFTASRSVVVGGTLTLNANPFLAGANTHLILNGPAIAGTPTSLSAVGTTSLTFGGASAGVSVPDKTLGIANLTISNTNGIAANGTSTSVVLGGVLSLQGGVLNMGSNTLTTTSACSLALPTPGTAGSWVAGSLRAAAPSAQTCVFPLGDAATNSATLQLALSAVSTPGSITASVLNEDHRNTTAGTSGIDFSKSVNRYWTLKDSTLAATYALRFSYVTGDNDVGTTPGNYRVRRGTSCVGTGVARNCTPWGSLTVSGTPTTTAFVTAGGNAITADSPAQADFSIGEADPSTNFQREKRFIYTRELY